jgi:hypothetical protein
MSKFSGSGCRIRGVWSLFYAASTGSLNLSYLILVLTERGSQILSSASTKNNSPEPWGILNVTSLNLSITHRLGTSNMGKSEQGKRNNAAAGGLPYSRVKSTNVFKFNTNLGQHVLKNPGGRFSIWLLVALE